MHLVPAPTANARLKQLRQAVRNACQDQIDIQTRGGLAACTVEQPCPGCRVEDIRWLFKQSIKAGIQGDGVYAAQDSISAGLADWQQWMAMTG
jgi:hypothetical protein